MATSIREATHAGSWYSNSSQILDSQLSAWLEQVPSSSSIEDGELFEPPIQHCKAIIAPHAGYSYSGPAAAWAYKSINIQGIKRVFLLGPSHHIYLDGCALSSCTEYATPIGNLPIDIATVMELRATGNFANMSLQTDEDEHSLEMHLPYIKKIFHNQAIQLVPILVGSISQAKETLFGSILAPYLAQDDTIFVVSSDFCHWGSRFSYTYYSAAELGIPPFHLTPRNTSSLVTSVPIHKSISTLDHEAMNILAQNTSDSSVHAEFANYLKRTNNTICGRHPIGVLVGALESSNFSGKNPMLRWVRYEQSSKCETLKDSSVSYASAYVVF